MVVNIIFVGIIIAGAMVTMQTRREIFPTMVLDIVNISVVFPGAAAEEVEEGVTIKIEEAIQSVTGIDYITSNSREGGCSVTAYMKTNVGDPRKVFQDIKDKIDQIFTFPDDAEEPNIQLMEHTSSVVAVAIYGDVDRLALKTLADDVREELLLLPDVSKVEEYGMLPREMVIELSEENMQRYGITFDEVTRAVRSYDLDVSGGTIKTDVEELNLRANGKNYRPEDLAEIVLRALPDGTKVYLRDVAEVKEVFEDVNYEFDYNGKPAAALMVMKTEQDDAIRIAEQVKKYVKEKQPELADGITIEYWGDLSKILNQRISLLVKNAKYGIALIFIILMVFLSFKLSFWVAAGLPVSVMGTILLMRTQDVTINMISLFAFITVLGILVDDAIVVSENVMQYIEKGLDPVEAAIEGTVEVMPAVVASVLTTMAAFAPFLFIEGVWGKFLFPIPVISIFGLLVSMFECFFILPAHLAHSLRPIEEQKNARGLFAALRRGTDNVIQSVIRRTYNPVIKMAIRFRWGVFAFGIAMFIISIGVVRSGIIKFVFFPEVDGDNISIVYTLEPGSSMKVQDAVAAQITGALDQLNKEFTQQRRELMKTRRGMKMYGAVGADQPIIKDEVTIKGGTTKGGANSSIGQVYIEMIDGEARGISSKKIAARWRELIGEVPGVLRMDINSNMGPPGVSDVEVQLRGDDMNEIMRAASLVKKKMREYPGVHEVQDNLNFGKREINMELKDRGKALGLTLADLISQVRSGFYGQEIHRVQRGREEIKVWVRYPESERNSIADFEAIKIRTREGFEVPLPEVARFSTSRQLRSISRFDRKREITVKCKTDGVTITPAELKSELRKAMPGMLLRVHGVTYSFEGQNRSQMQMMKSLGKWYLVALVAIFIIIALTFRNYLHSFMIMLLIPLGFVGALAGHLLVPYMNARIDRMDLTFLSIAGIVTLAGIVINDSIVMVHAIKRNLGKGNMTLDRAVYQGAVSRFRPIVLTTFTTSIGLMPLVLEQSLQAQFLIPMACSIAFGLLVATFFTQVWLPATFLILTDLKRLWYVAATGKLYSPTVIERNALPEGNFIKGIIPSWLVGLIVLVAVAVYLKVYIL